LNRELKKVLSLWKNANPGFPVVEDARKRMSFS
jgi:hypothetical protein